jgi:NADH-quinone oxidoreductase subunit G
METVTLTIDDRQVTVEKGKTVLQAAIEGGISVPYYCYHPGIGVDGSCRVCIVKIEKMPKLQTSCSTVCTDGMVVHTRADDVVSARASVFEFLLANHPLDCPVCDKGGECPLQDFSYTFGPEHSRMEFPRRVFDGEGVRADVDFGPTLMLNRNRCILCTRCVRFMREVEGDAQIGIIERGYGSEIATFREQGVHSLLSGNLVDVCPVGAITSKDYRFKSRPWDNPTATDTICTLCSKGCNAIAWVKAKPEWAKGSQLVRFTPRFNPDVNGYWMCDIGRYNYHWIEGDDRLHRPLERGDDGVQNPVSWQEAMSKLAGRFREAGTANPEGVRFLVSAHASNEELFLVRRLADELIGSADAIVVGWRLSEKLQPEAATFKVPPIDAPNVNGARWLGLVRGRVGERQGPPDIEPLRAAIEAGKLSALYVLDPGPDTSMGDAGWLIDARRGGRLPLLIFQGVLATELARVADFVLPGASWVEKEASYCNDQGRLQAATRAMAPPGEAMEDWQILVNLGVALGARFDYGSVPAIRSDIAARFPNVNEPNAMTTLASASRPAANHWLETSNPSERWKWDFMFRDLPPTKFSGEPFSTNFEGVIPLKEVK